MKRILLVCISVMVLSLSFSTTYAKDREKDRCNNRCGDTTVVQETIIEKSVVEQTIINNVRRTSSLSAASGGHQFYLGSPTLQWSVVGVHHESSIAASFALGKKVNGVFISGGVTIDDEPNDPLVYLQASGKFK